MKKSERLNRRPADKRKTNYKGFLLANVLTLFFALAPASPAGGPVALAAGNIFNFNQKSAYSEPFSKLIEFLNDKKNELEKYDGDFLVAKASLIDTGLRGSKSGVDEAVFNLASSSFLAAAFESIKSFVVDNPSQYLGTVFESVKNFVFSGNSQNDFEYNSPNSESAAREMENLKQQYAEAIDETKAINQKFNLLQNELGKIKNSGVIIKQPVIEQKTIERTIEKIVSGLSQTDLDSGLSNLRTELNNLNTKLTNQINTLSASSNRQTSAVYQAVSLTNKIDSLSGTRLSNITVSGVTGLADSDIPDGITASNYLLLTGGTITGSTTISGQTNLSNATSSLLTVSGGAWFTSGNVGIGTTSPYAKLSVVGPVAAEYFHATSTTATSTFANLTVNTQLKIGSDYLTDITGTNLSITNGVLNATGGSGVSADWNKQTNYGVLTLTPTTTIPIWAKDAIYASSTLTAQGLATFGNASTSQISATNSYLGTVLSGTWNGTAVANNYGGTGLDSSALTGIAQIVSGTWSASSTLSAAFGGTGWGNLQANTVLLGNGAGRIATTTAGTDGYVLGLSAGVPTWLATSTLSTITGTLTVSKGGTGQTSFGQGWLHSDGTTFTSSTSPTVNYITATSTTATSTFPYLSITTNSNLGTVVGGTWQGTVVGAQYGGTGQNFSASSGLVNFYSGTASTIATSSLGLLTTNVTEGTNLYWTNDRFDTRLSATTTLPNLTTLLGLTNATTTGITSTNSWLGTIRSGAWNGTAITDPYISSATTWNNKWDLASSTIPVNKGGTGLTSGYNNTNWDTAYTNRITSATYPLSISSNNMSLAFGTTTSNTWAGTQTFTNTISGSVSGNAGTVTNGVYTTDTGTVTNTMLANSTISGVALGGTLANLTATDGSLTFSGTYTGAAARTIGLNLGNANTWTALQTFGNASTTQIGSTGSAYFATGGGNVGIGTTTPAAKLHSLSTTEQLRLGYDSAQYAQFTIDTNGNLKIDPTGSTITVPDQNLKVCAGDACQTTATLTGNGNLTVENNIEIGGNYNRTCATGYVWVPGSAKFGTLPGFCVMKYEAKNDGSNNAVSTATGGPYVSIDQPTSRTKCEAVGLGYHLISEPEWMTIAENIAQTPINDMDDDAGLQLATGHSDNAPASALAATSASDPVVSGCNLSATMENAANAYSASSCEIQGDGSYAGDDNDKGFYGTSQNWATTGYSSGVANKSQLRTHILSNGNVIWDIAGNIWEWTDAYVNGTAEKPAPTADVWAEYTAITDYTALNYSRPQNPAWTSANGIGQYYAGASVGQRGLIRGGSWGNGAYGGVFTLNLGNAPSLASADYGFRCSR